MGKYVHHNSHNLDLKWWKWQIGQYDEGRVARVAEEETKVAEEDEDSKPSSDEEEDDD